MCQSCCTYNIIVWGLLFLLCLLVFCVCLCYSVCVCCGVLCGVISCLSCVVAWLACTSGSGVCFGSDGESRTERVLLLFTLATGSEGGLTVPLSTLQTSARNSIQRGHGGHSPSLLTS